MKKLAFAAALALAAPAFAQQEAETFPSPGEIVDAAPASDWVGIAAEDLLVMDLAPDRDGNARRVVIQLMPPPFSQGWIDNMRVLAKARWWDGTSVYRVQDNYVVQWGDATGEKPLPGGLKVMTESEYVVARRAIPELFLKGPFAPNNPSLSIDIDPEQQDRRTLPNGQEYMGVKGSVTNKSHAPQAVPDLAAVLRDQHENIVFATIITLAKGKLEAGESVSFIETYTGIPRSAKFLEVGFAPEEGQDRFVTMKRDLYAEGSLFADGWPTASAGKDIWPVHCYGMVGVGRDLSPNTGNGAELYTVIGHAPRHLDRNIALVGRIIEGMEHLSSLPRGHGPLGFYGDDETDRRVPILSVRLGNELEQFPAPQFQYLSTESESFSRYAEARANRRDPFFIVPAGGADICNIPVPVRRAPAE